MKLNESQDFNSPRTKMGVSLQIETYKEKPDTNNLITENVTASDCTKTESPFIRTLENSVIGDGLRLKVNNEEDVNYD